jgi:hypothetical protein
MQVFISYRDFSDPLIPFAIALFNHILIVESRSVSRFLKSHFDRPLSIFLNLKPSLIVLIQFLKVLSPF